jgi:hypothetical protein
METMSFSDNSSMTNINYNPTVDGMPQNGPDPNAKIPEGLIMPEVKPAENKVEESQMADFATPIAELVTPGPGQMMQNEVMGPPMGGPAERAVRGGDVSISKKGGKANPLGLTDEQYLAVIAGISALAAFSKPVQDKLVEIVPSMLKDSSSDLSTTGMALMVAIVALIFYFARRTLMQ